MFRAGTLGLGVVVCLIGGVTPAPAAPITYEYSFSGTLAQPYNGSNQFSGTFSYNTSLLPGYQTPGMGDYIDPTAQAVSLSLNIGNTSSSTFGPVETVVPPSVGVGHSPKMDSFSIGEGFSGSGAEVRISMINDNTIAPGPFNSTSLPASLDLASFNMGAGVYFQGPDDNGQTFGTITSLVPIPVPEPSNLLIFAALGACACGLGRVRRAR